MAKKKRTRQVEQNKSLAIRQYKAENPEAKPKEIAEQMSSLGLDASPQYVSTILSNERRKSGFSGSAGLNSDHFSVKDLHMVKQLVASTGSVQAAYQAIKCYEELLV